MKYEIINTPIGELLAVADESALYFLNFLNENTLFQEIAYIERHLKCSPTRGKTTLIYSIQEELSRYFRGELKTFDTPVTLVGTHFQTEVWQALKTIPYAETRAYKDISLHIGNEEAHRAVAQACGANRCAIIIPCHRVISADQTLGGYRYGLDRKQWLLNHETGVITG